MKELYGVVLMYLDGYKVSEDDFGDLWCSEVPEEYLDVLRNYGGGEK